jgi:WD40 repeat protein
VLLWDLRDPASPQLAATWVSPPRPLNAVAVLDDGTVLASSGESLISSWAGLDGGRLTTIHEEQDPNLNPAVIIPDAAGSRALVAGPSVSTGQPLVDLRSGRLLQSFKASGGEFEFSNVLATTWTSTMDQDGDRVAAFDLAGRGFLFSAQDGSYLGALLGHGDLVQRAIFTTDGRLFSAGLDGTVRTWDAHAADTDTSGSLVKALCTAFGDHMDADSWKLAMGKASFDSPCPTPSTKAATAPLEVRSTILDQAGPG